MDADRALWIMHHGNEAQKFELSHLIAHAEKELHESRKATEAVQQHAEERERGARALVADLCTQLIKVTGQNGSLTTANRKLCAEQVQLIRALRALVDVCNTVREEEGLNFPDGPFETKIREATEVLTLVEIPF